MKSEDTTRKPLCLICLEEIEEKPIDRMFSIPRLLCDECLRKREFIFKNEKISGIKIKFLFEYNTFNEEYIIRYKEKLDIALSSVFLYDMKLVVKLLCLNHLVTYCPSSASNIEKRGFDHMKEILKSANLSPVSLLSKGEESQKEKGFVDRFSSKDISLAVDRKEIEGKRIVLFDDIYTTGETFNQSVNVLLSSGAKSVKGIILFWNRRMKRRG